MKTRKTFRILFTVAVCAAELCSLGFRPANTTVALITKTVQEVTKKTPVDEWKKAAKGDPLLSGDQVQTGLQSLAIVTFIDKSIVRLREQSLLSIVGESGGPGALSKTVQLSNGAFGFDVKKQHQNELFRMTSPTSVA